MTILNFVELIERARQGDSEAATRLVQEYEPHVRRVLRAKIVKSSLRHRLESLDLCQSVMGEFFVNHAFRQYEIDTPEQLKQVLFTLAKHKLFNQIKYFSAQKRNGLRTQGGIDELPIASDYTSPSVVVTNQELLQKFQDRFTHSERFIAEQRKANVTWESIAQQLNGDKNALRTKLNRAIARISSELGLTGGGNSE
jgi:DNA-directed RNA polymerase specialized sigma24 family protein